MNKKIKLILFIFLLPISSLAFECSITDIEGKSDSELEAIAIQCEKEAQEQKILLDKKQRESVTIERDISILDNKINKSNLDIRATKVRIYQIGQEIDQKEIDIKNLTQKSKETLEHLSVLIKRSNELDSFSYLEALLSEESISSFFIDSNDFDVIKKGLRDKLDELQDIKVKTEISKTQLESAEMNERGLKVKKEKEKQLTINYKSQKNELLSLNRNQEAEYKATIAEKERVKTAIKNRLFRTVGGVELTFGEALKLIQPY